MEMLVLLMLLGCGTFSWAVPRERRGNPCEYKRPLKVKGVELNCNSLGRTCPPGSQCVVGPADEFAVCCPIEDEELVCESRIDKGACDDNLVRWAFDAKQELCIQFTFGGCDGNGNNFETFIECRDACQRRCPILLCPECENGNTLDFRGCKTCTCKDTCDLPAEPGRCRGSFPRFYHNPTTRQCEQFIYGGCGGNANRFETFDECFDACNPCPVVDCLPDTFCPLGFQKTEAGCDTCTCLEISDICNVRPDSGPCEQFEVRYYYNFNSGGCEPFIYGGCVGNGNNFATVAECEELCSGQ